MRNIKSIHKPAFCVTPWIIHTLGYTFSTKMSCRLPAYCKTYHRKKVQITVQLCYSDICMLAGISTNGQQVWSTSYRLDHVTEEDMHPYILCRCSFACGLAEG